MSAPLVSLLMPCWNAERYLAEAVEGALGQTYPNIELICVDDGSTDGTRKLLESYGSRLRLEAGPHRGAPAARNRGLELARGEFIQFLDADDVADARKIERQLPRLIADEADLVFCNQRVFGRDGVVRDKPSAPPTAGVDSFVYALNHASPGVAGHITTQLPLHRQSLLEAVGGHREGVRRSQDKDLVVRLAAAGARFHYHDEILLTYRDHDGERITNQGDMRGHRALMLCEIAEIVESGPPYTMTPERRELLGRRLFERSIEAYQSGAREVAARGFRKAAELATPGYAAGSSAYAQLTGMLGGLWTERLLRVALPSDSLRQRFRGLPTS